MIYEYNSKEKKLKSLKKYNSKDLNTFLDNMGISAIKKLSSSILSLEVGRELTKEEILIIEKELSSLDFSIKNKV